MDIPFKWSIEPTSQEKNPVDVLPPLAESASETTPQNNDVPPPSLWHFIFGLVASTVCVLMLLLTTCVLNWVRAAIFVESGDGPAPEGYKVMLEGMDVIYTMMNSLVLTKALLYAKSNGQYYLYENPMLTRGYPDIETDKSQPTNQSAINRLKCYHSDFQLFFLCSLAFSIAYRLLKATLMMP